MNNVKQQIIDALSESEDIDFIVNDSLLNYINGQKMPVTHFLFGTEIVRAYESGGINAACAKVEEGEMFGAHTFEWGTNPIELVKAFDGYYEYVVVTEEEYNKIINTNVK